MTKRLVLGFRFPFKSSHKVVYSSCTQIQFGAVVEAAHYGSSIDSGVEMVDELLNRVGLDSMMWTVSLILFAMVFGGIMEKTGMLEVLAHQILKLAKNTGSLVLATILTSIAINILAADQ